MSTPAGPTRILVHGAGMWPGLFAPLVARDVPTVTWVRPGYEGTPPEADLEGQVDRLAEVVDRHRPAVVVGVSGGATLALALAVRGIARGIGLAGLVTHEPLVGTLQPQLHARVAAAVALLADTQDAAAVWGFLEQLYGPASLDAAPDAAIDFVQRHLAVIATEVPHFAAFEPDEAALAGIEVPHLTTVGRRSGEVRLLVAHLLERLGAAAALVDGAGHLVLVDAPTAYAEIVRDFVGAVGRAA